MTSNHLNICSVWPWLVAVYCVNLPDEKTCCEMCSFLAASLSQAQNTLAASDDCIHLQCRQVAQTSNLIAKE